MAKLAIENSSAFASLLGKVLPTTLTPESGGGPQVSLVFKRIIVHPKDVTPSSPALPKPDEEVIEAKDIKELDS